MGSFINELNDDELLMIFTLLDVNSLRTSRNVCERCDFKFMENFKKIQIFFRWQILINENSQLYGRFTLKINGYNFNENDYDKDHGKIQKSKNKQKLEKFIMNQNEIVKIAEFTLPNGLANGLNTWMAENILAKLQNLQKLTLNESYMWDPYKHQLNPIFLPKLKELDVYYKYPIVAPKLEKLIIQTAPRASSLEMIKTFPNLKHLSLRYSSIDFKGVTGNLYFKGIPQKLTSLEIYMREELSSVPDYSDIINLLKQQRENLKTLKMCSFNNHKEMEFCIYEMKLENLTLRLPSRFESCNKPITTIKSFELTPWSHGGSAYKILGSLQSIEKLSLDCLGFNMPEKILDIVKDFLPNLKELKLTGELYEIENKIELDLIEIISIEKIRFHSIEVEWIRSFMNLILSCRNLKKIFIRGKNSNDFILPPENFLEILGKCKNLQKIYANSIFRLLREVVGVLMENSLNLRKLKFEVNKINLFQQLEHSEELSRSTNIQCTILLRK